jgi:ABC-type multidrug transport system ATPase subunit/ABC-type transport system involved in multi-copper enzyme maturation permease subunit
MIDILALSKRYGRRTALDAISLSIKPGELVLLLGANGAGKSTLLRCLLGITGFEGEVRVAGLDPLRKGTEVRTLVGYMPQSAGLHPDLTVGETMRFYGAIRRACTERCASLLDEAGLTAHAETKVGELSGGMRQRLGFAIALISDPPILVLDEPSASLDAASRRWLAARLRDAANQGRCVIVSTHAAQELVDAADRHIQLEEGRVVADDCRRSDTPIHVDSKFTTPKPRTATALPLVRKELRDAIGNRWLIGYAVLLGALGLAATASGLDSTSGLALQTFGRTTATLMNLCLLLSPLVAVLIGAGLIAGERERGTLEHLLAQPISRTALLLSKHGALLLALTGATVAGFVPAGALIAVEAGPSLLPYYALFPLIAALAAASMAGIGALISVSSRSAAQAQGMAIFVWFAFVLLYDLLLMGALAVSGVPVQWLVVLLGANPVDAARVLGVLALEPDLYLLGPAGAYLTTTLSRSGTAVLLGALLALWTLLPLAAAVARFASPSGRFPVLSFRRLNGVTQNRNLPVTGLRRTRHDDRVRGRRCVGSIG